ncbi:MAG: hypothetical protein U1E69_16120 [Tabrizicola sp.]|uniref:hypothetical protein n=1 Tax=Tabrizicola sp. TaxID=2005166 RepID=UPI002ABAEB20|nr:hypothetical protein [Tabrizicola sp.]MDZ4088315.1 hypothetical protein [Tabrizicola sp.]
MQAEGERFVWTLLLALAAGAAFFVLRLILAWRLRKRMPAGLVPQGNELYRPDGMSRIVSLIGIDALAKETLGTRRLQATLGLKLLYWGVLVALVVTSVQMKAKVPGIETAIILLVFWLALHTTFYEISYDRDTITLPRWWFGHTTHKWRELEAVTERQGWFLAFHFRGGKVVQAHKYVVGYAALREKAQAVLREV